MIAIVERMSDSPDHRPDLRISDTDRDRAAEVLREAHAQGRITVDELDERLTSVYSAKTFADLVPVTRDLPATQDATAGALDPSRTKMKTIVRPLQEALTARSARPLTVLLVAVTLILLMATANVATLLSSRAAGRQREISLRTALGATGTRVIRQLLTESIALALLGAVVGIALATLGVRAFMHSPLASLPRIDEVSVDERVLAFTLGISVLSGMLFGLLPAVHGAP